METQGNKHYKKDDILKYTAALRDKLNKFSALSTTMIFIIIIKFKRVYANKL